MLGSEIFFELGDEIEGRRLETVFKVGKDLVGGINAGGRSSLGLLANLEEEEWVVRWWMLNAEIRIEELSFNADWYWENDEDTHSSRILNHSHVIEF